MAWIKSIRSSPIFRWFVPQELGNPDDAKRGRMIGEIILAMMVSVTVVQSADLLILPEHAPRWLSVILAVNIGGIAGAILLRRGYLKTVGWSMVVGLWLLLAVLCLTAQGVHSPSATAYPVLVLLAALVLGEGIGMLLAVVSVLWTLFLVVAGEVGWITETGVGHTRLTLWLMLSLNIALVIALQHVATGAISSALARAKNELAEREEAEKALRATEERFRMVAEQTGQLIYDWDIGSGKIHWEGAIDAITGFSREEFERVGIAEWESMIHPDDRARAAELLEGKVESGEPYSIEYWFRRKGGAYVLVEDHGVFVKDPGGAPGRMLGTMQDVTERRMSEGALKESFGQLRDIHQRLTFYFSRMPLGCVVWNREFLVSEWNPAAENIFGWASDEAIGHHAYKLIVPADVQPHVTRVWEDLLAGGEWSTYSVNENVSKSGSRLICEWFNAPLRDAHGEIIGCLSMVNDITARTRAEAEKSSLEAQLRQSQKMQALGTLAGGIAHDFNNVITAIIGNAQLAEKILSADHPAHRFLASVDQACSRAADLVRRILTFSRPQEARKRLVDLTPAIGEALDLLRATLPAMVEIRTDFSGGLPEVMADPTQIHQVVMNLGTNAAHAMGERGGTLSVGLSRELIDAERARQKTDLRAGEYVHLTVSDTGCGMSRAMLDRIFEPFFTTKEPGKGTGLGLSVVHGIVKAHEGSISVVSEPGKGTSFHIYFPAATGKPAREPSEAGAPLMPPEKGESERILYVDGEESLMLLGVELLTRAGYRVSGFTSSERALEAFGQDPSAFDAVVADFSLAGISGLDFVGRLLRVRPGLSAVMISGHVRPEDAGFAERSGIKEVLSKPDIVSELAPALGRLFAAKRRG